MSLVGLEMKIIKNFLPCVHIGKIDSVVSKRAQSLISKKGFIIPPELKFVSRGKDKAAHTLEHEGSLYLNSDINLGFFIFPKTLKATINHETKHLEQNILKKAPSVAEGKFDIYSYGMKDFDKSFFKENSKLAPLSEENLKRIEQLKKAKFSYPDFDKFLEQSGFNQLNDKKVTTIQQPFKKIKLYFLKKTAYKNYCKAYDANFIESEALKAEKNNGSVFA